MDKITRAMIENANKEIVTTNAEDFILKEMVKTAISFGRDDTYLAVDLINHLRDIRNSIAKADEYINPSCCTNFVKYLNPSTYSFLDDIEDEEFIEGEKWIEITFCRGGDISVAILTLELQVEKKEYLIYTTRISRTKTEHADVRFAVLKEEAADFCGRDIIEYIQYGSCEDIEWEDDYWDEADYDCDCTEIDEETTFDRMDLDVINYDDIEYKEANNG